MVSFQIYHVEHSIQFCGGCCDYVEVSYGGTSHQLCGQNGFSVPDPIISTGTTMTLRFSSDSAIGHEGFLAVICCDVNVTTDVIGKQMPKNIWFLAINC